ncbi:MAG: hypothetical protein JNL79_32140 [Myxococcales bacterium]|nr:hypothetical protein [Myxococcales bacterium]
MSEEEQISLAKALFNEVWSLLDQETRSPAEVARMIHAAHASRYLWQDVGTEVQHARGEWQVSRVYSVLRRSEPALFHARLCLEVAESGGLSAFDRAFAHEALARGWAVAGELEKARAEVAMAKALAPEIEDEEDRQVLEADLATVPLG